MTPPVALQMSVGRALPPSLHRAVAANAWVPPGDNETLAGLRVKVERVGPVGAMTKTAAVSARPQLQDAMTANVPANCPAANKPPIEILPPVAL
jgi:hypothetical protein